MSASDILREIAERARSVAESLASDPVKAARFTARAAKLYKNSQILMEHIDRDPERAARDAAAGALQKFGPMAIDHAVKKLKKR